MKIKFKKLDKSVPSPFKKYPSDFCWDLYATSCEEIAPNVYKYGLGIAIEMERDWEIRSWRNIARCVCFASRKIV